MQELSLSMPPSRAYHFPDSPYVEYKGSIPGFVIIKIVFSKEKKSLLN